MTLEPHDPARAAAFERERAALALALGDWVTGGIHHVGGTAVPGMAARPVIDVLVGVRDPEPPAAQVERLEALGYERVPAPKDESRWRGAHRDGDALEVHVVPTGSRRFRDELLFRDRLRSHPEEAAEYEALRRTRPGNRAKEAFIERTVERAQADPGPGPAAVGAASDHPGRSRPADVLRAVLLKLRHPGRVAVEWPAYVGSGARVELREGGELRLGRGARVGERARLTLESELSMGPGSVLGEWCSIRSRQPVWIGERALLADRVRIEDGPVTVEDGATVGTCAVLLAGGRVARGATVPAGAAVGPAQTVAASRSS